MAVGWPGSEIGYLYGLRQNLSLGATVNLGYGLEGAPYAFNMAVKGTVKWRFAKLGPFDAGVRFDLGYYFNSMPTQFHGIAVDASFLLHYQVANNLAIVPFFSMPMRFGLGNPFSIFLIPVYVGVATEYKVLPRLTIFARVGLGGTAMIINYTPTDASSSRTEGKVFFEATVGAGYAF